MRKWITDQVAALGLALGDEPSTERLLIYAEDLSDIAKERLAMAFQRARREYEYPKLPAVAFIRRLAGASAQSDGRPGTEEAWARMPKGEHIEDDTIVWCDEERLAYGACRGLLQDGDKIGARLAFKERYEREVLIARSEGLPVRWRVSAGYDVEHRLVTLARAVEEGRITTETAMNFVPGERQSDFSRMLPPGKSMGLLEGKVEKLPNLPGLAGILAQMKMEDVVPEELKSSAGPPPVIASTPSSDELRERRERLNEQIEFLKRSRNDQQYRKLG